MFNRIFRKIGISIIILSLIMCFSGASFAAGLLASPGGFKITMEAPQTYQGSLVVENIGNEQLDIKIEPKRIQKDNIHILFSDEGIATWITVNPTNFTLSPGEKKNIKFTVRIPANINYYDAAGALLISGYPKKTEQNLQNNGLANLQVQQVPQIAVPIDVGFPGEIIESLVLEKKDVPNILLSFIPGSFSYLLKNNGTVYANMTGNVQLDGWFTEDNLKMEGEVYPGDQYYLMTNWTPGLEDFGVYQAKTTINYGRFDQNQTLQTNDTLIVIPVWLIFIILIIFIWWVIRTKGVKSPLKIKIERK
jgi:hypothetical protein